MMADKTKIEWADATVNYVNGCSVLSPGCKHCYAMKQAHRFPVRQGLTEKTAGGMVWTGEVRENPKALDQVLRWQKPRAIFWNAHGDLFHESVPGQWIDQQFAVMALTPQHRHMVLTKRSERMREYFSGYLVERIDCEIDAIIAEHVDPLHRRSDDLRAIAPDLDETWPLPNVWLGVSVEDQRRADERIPDLLATPAAIRFISAEPLLGPVDLLNYFDPTGACCGGEPEYRCDVCPSDAPWRYSEPSSDGQWAFDPQINWVIAGGESGPNARPMHPDWTRSLRDQCASAGVAFTFKQWGEWLPWEPGCPPEWESQNGRREDHHALLPVDIDADPKWDDGLWAIPEFEHFAFQRVGKKAAGRLLDGIQHDAVPTP